MKHSALPILILAFMLFTVACDRSPDYVLSHGKMVDLLVDVHKGEAVVSKQINVYNNDSLRKLLRQSIYANHNVTKEQVDTSLVWYGKNIEEYISVYEDVISRLQKEVDGKDESTRRVSGKMSLDSTDVWSGPKWMRIAPTLPSRSYVFDLDADDAWRKGDNYQLQAKIINPTKNGSPKIRVMMVAEYEDGTREYRTGNNSRESWLNVRFVMDSTLVPVKFYGYMMMDPDDELTYYLDSISMIRTRLNGTLYNRNGHNRVK